MQTQHFAYNMKILQILRPVRHLLTNDVSSEIVLKLNIVVIFTSMFIDKHSFEVVREKAGVGSQVKFKISTVRMERKNKRVIRVLKNQCKNNVLTKTSAKY